MPTGTNGPADEFRAAQGVRDRLVAEQAAFAALVGHGRAG